MTEASRETQTLKRTLTLSGVLIIGVAWVTQLVHPGTDFANVDSAALELAHLVGGNLFAAVV